MAYFGLIRPICEMAHYFKAPAVLEIGVDKGMTFIPLVHYFMKNFDNCVLAGCDIRIRESVKAILANIGWDFKDGQQVYLMEKNSLELLPALIQDKIKFDFIFLDGDHNYYTVSKELEYINQLVSEDSILICDDYHGRWSEKDLYYSDRPEEIENKIATSIKETSKKGVKNAIDDFLIKNTQWKIFEYGEVWCEQGEPIVLHQGSLDKFTWNKESE